MKQPNVTIITLNWNGLEDTTECLESLKKINYPNYKVIVVDNGSVGNDVPVLEKKFGDFIHLIKNDRNYGACAGRNIAIRHALDNSNFDYLVLLDNDAVVDPEFLTEMVKVAETDPVIGIAGAKMYYYDEPDRLQYCGGKLDIWEGMVGPLLNIMREKILGRKEFDRGQSDSVQEVEHIAFWCALLKRKVIESVGLFDERHFWGWEDFDYFTRVKKAGFKVVLVPRAKVWHKYRSAHKTDGALQYYSLKSRFHLIRQYTAGWQYGLFLTYFFGLHFWLATAYYLIWLRRPGLLLSFYKGVRDGLLPVRSID
ncbi:MAG: glycosyltransferase family 2 protein [Dehalococcoidales bacterium]|jgi:GT2 family glycosyltransferase|nr:glycosyltransferase family 2 protein [Dehalococcoidales bacterium]MDP7416006.1 glycosyltransferase family 2 protein [Dehalococcoidales bacterium]